MTPAQKLLKAARLLDEHEGWRACACHFISLVEHGKDEGCWSIADESNAYPFFALFDPHPEEPQRRPNGTGRLWWPLVEKEQRVLALCFAAAIASSNEGKQ